MCMTPCLSVANRLQRLPTWVVRHTYRACQLFIVYFVLSATRMQVPARGASVDRESALVLRHSAPGLLAPSVDGDADHVTTVGGQRRRRHAAHVAETKNRDSHKAFAAGPHPRRP